MLNVRSLGKPTFSEKLIRCVIAASACGLVAIPANAASHHAEDCKLESVDAGDNATVVSDENFACLLTKIAALQALLDDAPTTTQLSELETRLKTETARADGLATRLKAIEDEPAPTMSSAIPSGAVVAFASSEQEPCPGPEWELYDQAKGRFIVGVGSTNDGTATRTFMQGQTDGKFEVKLTEAQMPRHFHQTQVNAGENLWGQSSNKKTTLAGSGWVSYYAALTNHAGSSQPHENMPPFIALYFCKKS